MRFKKHMEVEQGLRQIDIVPLINIVFLLLIFFMLTSGFAIQPGLKVNLPRAVTSEAVKFKNVEVAISSENAIYLNGKAVTMAELNRLLNQVAKNKQTILIKADRRASLGGVVEIWDMCRNLGISQINIATSQE